MKTLGLIANTSSASKAFAQCLLPFSLKNGVVSVFEVIKSREAVKQKTARFTERERYQVARLGALRIWKLKREANDRA